MAVVLNPPDRAVLPAYPVLHIVQVVLRLVNEKLAGEQKLQTLIEEYDKERSLINQEYLRRLEVIEGLSVNYESICYVDLDIDQIVPYRLSVRTSPLFHGST